MAGTVLTAIPMLAIAINFYQTARHDLNTLDANPTLRFTYVGLLFLFIAVAQQIVGALPRRQRHHQFDVVRRRAKGACFTWAFSR